MNCLQLTKTLKLTYSQKKELIDTTKKWEVRNNIKNSTTCDLPPNHDEHNVVLLAFQTLYK